MLYNLTPSATSTFAPPSLSLTEAIFSSAFVSLVVDDVVEATEEEEVDAPSVFDDSLELIAAFALLKSFAKVAPSLEDFVTVGFLGGTPEGKDNIVMFYTKRYPEQPMIIKGAGAGADVTASGLFADIIRIGNN